MLRYLRKRWKILTSLTLIMVIWYIFCIPAKPFSEPFSTVLYDRNGTLLEARVASDGQWRFPASDKIPLKLKTCIVEFEDRNFYSHWGISARGVGRAISQNFRNKKIVSGGSTITMQVARMMLRNRKRNIWNKLHEMIIATRLEIRYSKDELLGMYLRNAPFGNNVVGIDAASWRYFSRPVEKLSWAECATLAVLPNAPGLMYPGKNQLRLTLKRNRLLKRLLLQQKLDTLAIELAMAEKVPGQPKSLPNKARHLLQSLVKENGTGKIYKSTIDENMQLQVNKIAQNHHEMLKNKNIENGAVLVTSTKTGEVLAYIGNIASRNENSGSEVDCIRAARSSGSILKPLLFESALEDGMITPNSLLFDIPSQFGGYAPKNFNKTHEGAVPANKALSKSLNIPFVLLLNQYGPARFCERLKQAGIKNIRKNSSHYGLTLILGGAEVSLLEMTTLYRNMGAIGSNKKSGALKLLRNANTTHTMANWNRECVVSTLDCMTELNRPDEEGNWKLFASARKIAWKTGTSFGFRDAWAIGITPEYTVGVWIGNADGEGQPGLTGVNAAAPLMFDIFSSLKTMSTWFPQGFHLKYTLLCEQSGNPASPYCTDLREEMLPASCQSTPMCSYHKPLMLSPDGKHQANSNCFPVHRLRSDTFFILPPLVLKYFKDKNPVKEIPDFVAGCGLDQNALHFVYPRPKTRVLLHATSDNQTGDVVFEIAHKNPGANVYWHLDELFLGTTNNIHQMVCRPSEGTHQLTATDDTGHQTTVTFEVAGNASEI